MNNEQAWLRVAGLGGRSVHVDWLSHIAVPPGVHVDVADFGHRVTVLVQHGSDEVSLVADLTTGDVAESTVMPNEAPLVRFARLVVASRMVMDAPTPGPVRPPTTPLSTLLSVTDARWIRTDLELDDKD